MGFPRPLVVNGYIRRSAAVLSLPLAQGSTERSPPFSRAPRGSRAGCAAPDRPLRSIVEEFCDGGGAIDCESGDEGLLRLAQSVRGTVYYWEYLLNSVMYTTVTTVLQLFFASLAGFALSKYDFRGKRALMTFMIGSTMIPSVLLLAPVYKMFVDLGLIDSIPGLIVTAAVSAYGIFLFRQAIMSVPNEIIDAGRMDGCSEFGIYYRLVMPLVKPMSAAFCMFVFLAQWNAFFAPNIFLQSESNLTAPIVVRTFISLYSQDFGVFLAGTLLAIIPPGILFFALQKEFVSGLSSGAVKG